MRLLETEIQITACPESVWSILINLEKYSEWNPFIKNARGTVKVGEKLEVLMFPLKCQEMTFRPTVKSVIDDKTFTWLGHLFLPGIYAGEHMFILKKINMHFVFS